MTKSELYISPTHVGMNRRKSPDGLYLAGISPTHVGMNRAVRMA